jgi:hypothetical protein
MAERDFANSFMLWALWSVFAGPFLERIIGLALRHCPASIKYVGRRCIDVVAERLFDLFLLFLAAHLAGIPLFDGMAMLILKILP